MPQVEAKEKHFAWIVSSIVGVAVLVTACLNLWGNPLFDEYVLLAVMITVFPPAVLDYVDYRWKKSIDEHLPELFRTVVQAQQTGMTLPQAFEEASKRHYGPFTSELKKMVAQMSWGMSFEEAFQALGKRVNTWLVRRTVPLVIEAGRSGGQVEKIFEPLGEFVQSTLILDKERRTQTRPYIAIVYVAFFVFLFTIILLFKTFFVQIQEMPIFGLSSLTPEQTKRLLFHMSAIQAFFSGLVAGKMGEGTVSAGLKHAVLLMASGYLALKFFV